MVVAIVPTVRVIRAASPRFLLLLLLGSLLCLSSVFALSFHTSGGCQSYPLLLTLGAVLSFSSLFVKSWRVVRIFSIKQLKVARRVTDQHLIQPIALLVLIMLILHIIWITVQPQTIHHTTVPNNSVLTYPHCSGINSQYWVGAFLLTGACMLFYGVYIAHAARAVPTQFNESKLLALCIYQISLLSIIIVPLLYMLHDSAPDSINLQIIIQAVVIIYATMVNVALIVAPKLYYRYNPVVDDNNATQLVSGAVSHMPTDASMHPSRGGAAAHRVRTAISAVKYLVNVSGPSTSGAPAAGGTAVPTGRASHGQSLNLPPLSSSRPASRRATPSGPPMAAVVQGAHAAATGDTVHPTTAMKDDGTTLVAPHQLLTVPSSTPNAHLVVGTVDQSTVNQPQHQRQSADPQAIEMTATSNASPMTTTDMAVDQHHHHGLISGPAAVLASWPLEENPSRTTDSSDIAASAVPFPSTLR